MGASMFQSFEATSDPAAVAKRVAALRSELAARSIGGFMVPRADAHQGEVVAPRDERLAWLTGFTGSAGTAVILEDRAALFVDGRYTTQAARQTDGAVFEIVPVHETTVAQWLEQALGGDVTLGYDPWLHGKSEIDKLTAAAKARGATLTPVPDSPVDAVWPDQPPPPLGAVQVHSAELAGEDAADRRRRIGAALAESGAGAAVLTQPDSIAWLLNIRGTDLPRSPVALGFAVLRADGSVALYMEPEKIGAEVRAHLGNEVSVSPTSALASGMAELSGITVLADKATCPLWIASP
jgi:Xaa-Pro aminopeptidase